MKSNHLLLLALKKVREHVGEGTNTFRFLTSELGLLRSIQGIADVIHFIPMVSLRRWALQRSVFWL